MTRYWLYAGDANLVAAGINLALGNWAFLALSLATAVACRVLYRRGCDRDCCDGR